MASFIDEWRKKHGINVKTGQKLNPSPPKTAADYRVNDGRTQVKVGDRFVDTTDRAAVNIKDKFGVGDTNYVESAREKMNTPLPRASQAVMDIRNSGKVPTPIGNAYKSMTPEQKKQFQLADAAGQEKIAQGLGSNNVSVVQPPKTALSSSSTSTGGPKSYIDQLNDARRDKVLSDLAKSRNNALSNLESERSAIQPEFYDKRNDVAAASQQSARNLAEFMAARGGTRSGAAAQAEISRMGNYQGNLGTLGRQEAQAYTDIERRTSDVKNAYESDVASANAGIEADRMRLMLEDMYKQRQYDLARSQLTGELNGERTLAGQRFDYDTSPNNPNIIGQNISNQINQMKLSNLPETMRLELERLQQAVNTGAINQQEARYRLDELTNPNSVTNQTKQLQLELAQLEKQYAEPMAQAKLQEINKRIEQIGAEPALTDHEKQMQQLELEKAQFELNLMKNPPQTGKAEDFYSVINNSPYIAPVYETDPNNPFAAPRNTGRIQVTDQVGLERFILGLNIPNEEKANLYRYYNIPMN